MVAPMRQMSEGNQKLIWLKNKVAKQQRHSKSLEQAMGVMSTQLRLANEERNIVKRWVKMLNEENKKEMDYMDKLLKEKIAVICEAIEDKERASEKSWQDERRKVELYIDPLENREDQKHRQDGQNKGVTEFEAEREKLMTNHREEMTEQRRHYEEQVQSEKEFGDAMAQLMEKCQPHSL